MTVAVPSCIDVQLASAGVSIATHCNNIFHWILSQKTQAPWCRYFWKIWVTASDQPPMVFLFQPPALEKKEETHGVPWKGRANIDFFTSAQVYAIESLTHRKFLTVPGPCLARSLHASGPPPYPLMRQDFSILSGCSLVRRISRGSLLLCICRTCQGQDLIIYIAKSSLQRFWGWCGISLDGGTPKWMVYIQMDDLGVPPLFVEPLKLQNRSLHGSLESLVHDPQLSFAFASICCFGPCIGWKCLWLIQPLLRWRNGKDSERIMNILWNKIANNCENTIANTCTCTTEMMR